MLWASAVKVAESTHMPAIPGTMMLSCFWSPWKIAPKKARNSSGSPMLKNAALGLRQNSRRSRRNCRQVSRRASDIGGQLQVDLFQRGPADLEVVELLSPRDRLAGQLVQQAGRVVGDVLDLLAEAVAVRDANPGPVPDAELAGGALREDRAALDDRDPVGELLRLIEIVRGQQDRLAEVAQRAD